MMDKSELEEMLVKLKLGTLSAEDAVSELESCFYPVCRGGSVSAFRPGGYGEIFYCSGLSAGDILKLTYSARSKRTPYLCVRAERDAASELETSLGGSAEVFGNAGIIALRPKDQRRLAGRAVVACGGANPCRGAVEALTSLDLLGIDAEILRGSLDRFGGEFPRVSDDKSLRAVIAVSDSFSGVERLTSELSCPIVCLPERRPHDDRPKAGGYFAPPASLSMRGVTFAAENDGFGAALAVYRIMEG